MLHSVEAAGKDVTPGNIAYYVVLHMKSGSRSQSGSRADDMAPGTQLDRRSSVRSTEDVARAVPLPLIPPSLFRPRGNAVAIMHH
jgi:hypothetical protein